VGNQLDEPVGSSGSPPFSVFSCFSHYSWQIKYDDDCGIKKAQKGVPELDDRSLKWSCKLNVSKFSVVSLGRSVDKICRTHVVSEHYCKQSGSWHYLC